MAVPPLDHMQAVMAEPPMRLGDAAQHRAQFAVIRSPVPIPHRRPIRPDHGTRQRTLHR
jgi:hypothetical protein